MSNSEQIRLLAFALALVAAAALAACGGDDESGDGTETVAGGGFETVEDVRGGFRPAEPPPAAEPPATTTEEAETTGSEQTDASGSEQGVVTAIGSTVPLGDVSRGEAEFIVEFLEVDIGEGSPIQAVIPPNDRNRATNLFLDDKLGEGTEVEVRSTDGDGWEFVDVVD